MFARAVAAFGTPAALAALGVLSRAFRREIGGWLAPLEHIVRKLLFAEAARLELAPVSTAGLQIARRTDARAGAPAKNNCNDPETWRVKFTLALPSDPRVVPEARAPRIRTFDAPPPAPAPIRRGDAQRSPTTGRQLARRFEALRRVLDDPMPHARRLKRLLARAIRRFPEIAARFLVTAPRTSSRDEHDPRLSVEASGAAFDAPPSHNSS